MALKNYIKRNKKKVSAVAAVLLVMIVAITAVVRFNIGTKADVFKKDDEGNLVSKSEVNILEIVAEYGQQVIGYTVSGYEPISVEQIENYHGDIDIEDFRQATGYELEKSGSGEGNCSYKVLRSSLENVFNQNVLADAMEKGQIIVNVCQANDVTADMINNADLIYINTNNYNSNLLYYYDQMVNNGEKGVKAGETGADYDDVTMVQVLKKEAALKKIQQAAGRQILSSTLSEEDFYQAGIESYKNYNLVVYIDSIAALEKGALTAATDDDSVAAINALIKSINTSEKTAAISYIKNSAGNSSLTDEQKAELVSAFLKAELANCHEANYNDYVNAVMNNTIGYTNTNAIQTMISNQNTTQMRAAIERLIEYKASDSSIADVSAIEQDILKIAYSKINSGLISEYAAAFADDSFKFKNQSKISSCNTDLKGLIDKVNERKQNEALALIADAPVNPVSMELLQSDALFYFELADIEGFDKYNVEDYIKALAELEDVNSLKGNGSTDEEETTSVEESSEEETGFIEETDIPATFAEETTDEETSEEETSEEEESEEETSEEESSEEETSEEETSVEEETTSLEPEEILYDYDKEKITSFIADVNAKAIYTEQERSYDISWENALALYNYAIVDECGLMYDTELLTSGKIGDFNQNLETNTNNLYKILLLMRQLQPDYCRNSILPNIDENGTYNGNETGISAWYKYTFYSAGSNDYGSYREPNVVGKTYSVTGTAGPERNYVYKHIYSYTGEQFVGGALFVGESLSDFMEGGGALTPGLLDTAGDEVTVPTVEADPTDNWIFLDTGNDGRNWSNAYAYFWGGSLSSPQTIKMTTHDSGRFQYRVQVPAGAAKVIFKPYARDNWTGKTRDVLLSEGKYFYVKTATTNGRTNGPRKVEVAVPSGRTMYYGNLTNSKNNSTMYYEEYLDLKFVSYNVEKAYYKIDNGEEKTIIKDETIRIGEGLAKGSSTKITMYYYTYNGKKDTRTYTYKKVGYDYCATNASHNAEVRYFGSVDVKVTYSNVSGVKYSIDGGSKIGLSSGDVITIGNGVKEGKKTTLTVEYTYDSKNYTKTYYYQKVSAKDVNLGNNYLSTNTADNNSSLKEDSLQDAYVNEIITNGNKGDIMRYIMGITLNQLQSYPFNILEVQPTAAVTIWDSYEGAVKLADYLRIELPEGMTKENYSDYFKVSHMSVKEFNTRNEDLTGTYDLIYFGIDSGYQVVNPYTIDEKTYYRTYYNDTSMNGLVYTGIGDEYTLQGFLKGVAAEDYKVGSVNDSKRTNYDYWVENLTPQFRDNTNPSWNLDFDSNEYIFNDGASTTRLLGNDLTVKRMNQLLDYVKSGYPILLPDEIYNCDSNDYIAYDGNSENADKWRYVDVNSKMYNFITTIKRLGFNENTGEYDGLDENGEFIFYDGKPYANIVQEKYAKYGKNPDNLSAGQKFEGGLSFATKRNIQIEFELVDSPLEYNKVVDDNSLGQTIRVGSKDYTSYRYELKINSDVNLEWMNDNYIYQIYIDKAGTGRFDPESTIELDPRYAYNESKRSVILEGKWPGNMDGFVPWKVVAYNKNNPKNHFSYIGFSSFEIPESAKKTVYVLWVKTNTVTMNFQDMMTTYRQYIKEYDLKLLTIPYSDFVNLWSGDSPQEYTASNTKLRLNTILKHSKASKPDWTNFTEEEIELNPEFNMLVFGYCDSYQGLDINNIAAHNNIEYFVNSGHSMLFAHDNVSYLATLNYYDSNGNKPGSLSYNWARYSTAFLRDMLGMDVYGATYSPKCFDPSSEEYLEYLANTRKYLRDDLSQKDFRGIIELCVFHYTSTGGGNKLYSSTMHGSKPVGITDWVHTKSVVRMNQGQISEYPFIIGEVLGTATTHVQYMNLNMEDEDITVWYTLGAEQSTDNKYYMYTEGDGSNNYYIYSKGNITYTGAGHTSGQTPGESKLFINTVVAAIKAGNFAPEVNFPDADNDLTGNNIVYRYVGTDDDVTISFKPIDYDAAKNSHPFTDCKIFIDMDEDGVYTEGTDIWLFYVDDEGEKHTLLTDVATDQPINFVGTELENKTKYYFKLTDEKINEIVNSDSRLTSIYEKPITVQITDNGTSKDPEKKTTVSNNIRVVEAKLHDLN